MQKFKSKKFIFILIIIILLFCTCFSLLGGGVFFINFQNNKKFEQSKSDFISVNYSFEKISNSFLSTSNFNYDLIINFEEADKSIEQKIIETESFLNLLENAKKETSKKNLDKSLDEYYSELKKFSQDYLLWLNFYKKFLSVNEEFFNIEKEFKSLEPTFSSQQDFEKFSSDVEGLKVRLDIQITQLESLSEPETDMRSKLISLLKQYNSFYSSWIELYEKTINQEYDSNLLEKINNEAIIINKNYANYFVEIENEYDKFIKNKKELIKLIEDKNKKIEEQFKV